MVVSRQTCAKISEALGLQEFLILGKGMTTHPTVPPSLLADVFESLAAAIYLDGGDPAAREFIQRFMGPEIELAAAGELGGNYKSLLQQMAQRENGSTPAYTLLDEKGPDHSKCFKMAAQIGGVCYQARLGPQQKRSRAARRPQRAERNEQRASPLPVRLSAPGIPKPCRWWRSHQCEAANYLWSGFLATRACRDHGIRELYRANNRGIRLAPDAPFSSVFRRGRG